MVLEKLKLFFKKKEAEKRNHTMNHQTESHTEEKRPKDSLPNSKKVIEKMAFQISIEPTPNPNALKFVLTASIKNSGNSTYRSPVECSHNPLAQELFKVRGVDQIHFFENVITISKFNYQDWSDIEDNIMEIINRLIESHNPDYFDPDPEAERRRNLSEELKDIENILDKTIRPGLQADGGDVQTISYSEHILIIRYQGACGTCPSATTGTLEAIKAILRDQYNPKIDVYIEPSLY